MYIINNDRDDTEKEKRSLFRYSQRYIDIPRSIGTFF